MFSCFRVIKRKEKQTADPAMMMMMKLTLLDCRILTQQSSQCNRFLQLGGASGVDQSHEYTTGFTQNKNLVGPWDICT